MQDVEQARRRAATTVLLVEDEPTLARAVRYALEKEGYRTRWAPDGGAAVRLFQAEPMSVVLLDLMLPVLDGLDVCRLIRQSSSVPIIMLTAKTAEIDRVVGLEVGADDYLTKPFGMRELLARVKALLRRSGETGKSADERLIRAQHLEISPLKRTVTSSGTPVFLRPREFDLLLHLARHPGQVFTRDQLLHSVWGFDFIGESRTVDVHIRMLRQKLEIDPSAAELIRTVRNVGYSFG